jgi:hypothetical protein
VGDTAIARFEPGAGRLIGRALGTTTLLARPAGPGLDITWQIEVIAGGIQVVPDRVGFGVGDALPLQANFTTEAGAALGPAQGVQWTTENANVVRVDGEGRITGAGPGHARVIAATQWARSDTTDVFVQGSLLFTSSRSGSADLYAGNADAPADAVALSTRRPTKPWERGPRRFTDCLHERPGRNPSCTWPTRTVATCGARPPPRTPS